MRLVDGMQGRSEGDFIFTNVFNVSHQPKVL